MKQNRFIPALIYTFALFAVLHLSILAIDMVKTGNPSSYSLTKILDLDRVMTPPEFANNVTISVFFYGLVFWTLYFFIKPPSK